MMTMKKLFQLTSALCLAIVIFFSLNVHMWCNTSGNDEAYVQMISGSMFPTLFPSDLLKVENLNASEIYAAPTEGDILVFHAVDSDELIVHRAIEKIVEPDERIEFITMGDANSVPGPYSPTPAENVVGRVLAFRRDFDVGTWYNISYHIFVETNSRFLCPGNGKGILANITYYHFSFNESLRTVEFDLSGYISKATAGFCNVTIPKNLLHCDSLNGWQVKLNGTSTSYLAVQNETTTSIYFTYDNPVYTIQIGGTSSISDYVPNVPFNGKILGLDWWIWVILSILIVNNILLARLLLSRKKK